LANQKTISATADGDNIIHDVATADRTAVFDYTLTCAAGTGLAIVKDEAGTEYARYFFGSTGQSATAGPVGAGVERMTTKGDIIINCATGLDVAGHFTYAAKSN
jgi:hypothetical protein